MRIRLFAAWSWSTVALVGLLLAAPFHSASASAIYQYTGNNFDMIFDSDPPAGTYDTSMRVTGWFELASPLAPNMPGTSIIDSVLSFSFSDGRSTVTDADFDFPSDIIVSTDAVGQIAVWAVIAITEDIEQQISTRTGFSVSGEVFDQGVLCAPGTGCSEMDRARINDSPGTWTLVPVPSTFILMSSGLLAGLAWTRRRERLAA